MRNSLIAGTAIAILLTSGCAEMSDTQRRTAIGAGAGALGGAAIGAMTGGKAGTGAVSPRLEVSHVFLSCQGMVLPPQTLCHIGIGSRLFKNPMRRNVPEGAGGFMGGGLGSQADVGKKPRVQRGLGAAAAEEREELKYNHKS